MCALGTDPRLASLAPRPRDTDTRPSQKFHHSLCSGEAIRER